MARRLLPRRSLPSVALLLALSAVALGLLVSPAHAVTFTVNSVADVADDIPGNGACATKAAQCTLRAAIEETNSLRTPDVVRVPAGRYALKSRLIIQDRLVLYGKKSAATTLLDGSNATGILEIKPIELLVCDSSNDSLVSYAGQHRRVVVQPGAGGLDLPLEAHIGPDADVFVTGFTSGIHRYDRDTGSPKGVFVAPNSGGLLGPTDGAFAPFGHPNRDLYVTKYQPGGGILRYDGITGAFVSTFVPAGSGGLAYPNSIAFHDGDLFATSTGTHAVLRFDGATGALVASTVPSHAGGLQTPRDLVFRGNSLYVASEATDSVLRYDAATGAFQGQFVPSGSGGLDKPSDIEFGPDGNLYVISAATKQVLRYDGDSGTFIDIFVQGGSTVMNTPSCLVFRTDSQSGAARHVSISRMTLMRGKTSGSGAGLYVQVGASAGLTNAIVRGNSSWTFGGGVSNWGKLTIRRTEVTGNTLPVGGGGQTSQGGGVFNRGVLEVRDSLIADNFATRGGGISNLDRAFITNSTISRNRAIGPGGGIRNVANAYLNINSSTITANRANEPVTSIFNEPTRFGGGIFNAAPAQIAMANTILAGNSDNRYAGHPNYAPDCHSTSTFDFTSHRDNVVGVLTLNCALRDTVWGPVLWDLTGTPASPLDPRLGPLAANGGPTRTHALMATSPALDADLAVTSASFFDCQPTDQRSLPRPKDGNFDGVARCDTGAFEY